jgi:uncharacterized membrane protein
MHKGRLEAFSDGVIAIIITIMVLELRVPHGDTLIALKPLIPVLLSYILSFIFLGIYWNNHHHMLQTAQHVNGNILWANLHLLFWLSLIPATTQWMGENHFSAWPVALYGIILLGAATAYYILTKAIITHHGKDSILAAATGNKFKEKLSIGLYLAGILLAFTNSYLSCSFYVIVACMWLIPDRRIENKTK